MLKKGLTLLLLVVCCAGVGGIAGYLVSEQRIASRGGTIHLQPPLVTTLTDVEYLNISSTAPYLKFHNTTQEDTDGGRESLIYALGEQSGGEISRLAEIEMSHSGTSDDEKGRIILKSNSGSDGDSPSKYVVIDENGYLGLGIVPTQPLDIESSSSSYPQIKTTSPTGNVRWRVKNSSNELCDIGVGSSSYSTGSFGGLASVGFFVTNAANGMKVGTVGTYPFAIYVNDIKRLGFDGTNGQMTMYIGIVPAHKGSDPCGTGFPEGAIFWNMSGHYPCYCDHNGDDLKISDGSACF